LPPLEPKKQLKTVLFTNVTSVASSGGGFTSSQGEGVVVVANGTILCSGTSMMCSGLTNSLASHDLNIVDLEGGSISPGLISFGAPLGLSHIDQEPSTNDGSAPDPLLQAVPKVLGGDGVTVSAADGLSFASRDALFVLFSFYRL
jgi:hypothetical protein